MLKTRSCAGDSPAEHLRLFYSPNRSGFCPFPGCQRDGHVSMFGRSSLCRFQTLEVRANAGIKPPPLRDLMNQDRPADLKSRHFQNILNNSQDGG